jgi:hypothetical protein
MKTLLPLALALITLALVSCGDISPTATFNPATGAFEFSAEFNPVPIVEPAK